MNKPTIRQILFVFIILVSVTSCGTRPESLIEKGIAEYNDGKVDKGTGLILNGILSLASVKELDAEGTYFANGLLFTEGKKTNTVTTPFFDTLNISANYPSVSFNEQKKTLAAADTINAAAFSPRGSKRL